MVIKQCRHRDICRGICDRGEGTAVLSQFYLGDFQLFRLHSYFLAFFSPAPPRADCLIVNT